MKVDPEKLKKFADDCRWVIAKNPEIVQAEPEMIKDVVSARDKADKKYAEVRK